MKNILLPLLLIFGLAGYAGETFAAKSGHHDKTSSKQVKKKATHDKQKKKKAKAKKSPKVKKDSPQHKKTKTKKAHSGSAKSEHKTKQGSSHDKVVGKREDGRSIYEGPRGGRYYINDSGNKVYIAR